MYCLHLSGIPMWTNRIDWISQIYRLWINLGRGLHVASCQLSEQREFPEIRQANDIVTINLSSPYYHFEHCQVPLNQVSYNDNPNIFWGEVHIISTIFNEANVTAIEPVLKLKLEDYYHFSNQQSIELLKPHTYQAEFIAIIISSITLIIVIIAISLLTEDIKMNNPALHLVPYPLQRRSQWSHLYGPLPTLRMEELRIPRKALTLEIPRKISTIIK